MMTHKKSKRVRFTAF